jgi:hypothetical protein
VHLNSLFDETGALAGSGQSGPVIPWAPKLICRM